MKDNNLVPSFYMLKRMKGNKQKITIENLNINNIDLEKIDIKENDSLVFSQEAVKVCHITYECEFFCLPVGLRENIIKSCGKDSFDIISRKLFDIYCSIANDIRDNVLSKNQNIQIFCCIYSFDFCLVAPENEVDLKIIKQVITEFIEQNYLQYRPDFKSSLVNENIQIFRQKKTNCLFSDRQFVRYNPMLPEYVSLINKLDGIICDSIYKQAELSLYSSLVLKDLVEETHLYWLYESGEIRYENASKTYIISKRNEFYFKYFDLFCEQAAISNPNSDWIWSLVFLTEVLLASFLKKSKKECENKNEEIAHSNFFGFVPVFKDVKEKHNELSSQFSRHISRKYCHGFLVIPENSIKNIPAYFPAYIHEFFHYIPPQNRKERNAAILELVLHSLLNKLRAELPSSVYDDVFYMFKQNIVYTCQKQEFDYEELLSCDSMEYIERIKTIFDRLNIELTLGYISHNISEKYNKKYDFFIKNLFNDLLENFKEIAKSYAFTFILFFREIRSDMAMCLLLDIGLSKYIKILADEPTFASLPVSISADSPILRFGFMCRFLYGRNHKHIHANDWYKECCDIIDAYIFDCEQVGDSESGEKYNNLKSYLKEYIEISIENKSNQYTPKGESLLENVINEKGIVEDWVKKIDEYAHKPVTVQVRCLYHSYDNSIPQEKLKLLCGIRLLFRDFYSYDLK